MDIIAPLKWTCQGDVEVGESFRLSNGPNGQSEILFDYELAVGGMPVIETRSVTGGGPVEIDIIFSETYAGIQSETGDGPYFLFSNAMDTYRIHTQTFQPSETPTRVQLPFAQRSQRYQRVILKTQNSSLCVSSIGYRPIRAPNPTINSFSCSNKLLNKVWTDGVRSVDACTVEAGETAEAWEVTENGTRIIGQHWAPCRHGTRWGDVKVEFDVKIEKGGASWGVHMVANGLVFCLDFGKRSLAAFEGLSDTNGIFPTKRRGLWNIKSDISLDAWISVTTVATGTRVLVSLNGAETAFISGLDIHPILGGSQNNTGSVAFGGPQDYVSCYRNLRVTDQSGEILYRNDFLLASKDRTLADFAVGTNTLSCTIDGAKRDRALFGGDLFVMGRSICYSTANLDAILGSIKLLTSHQTADGYLGNLCPIQAPRHEESTEPPTYAFYSLSYALLLVVAVKDYWMHSGDDASVRSVWHRLEKLLSFVDRFADQRGLVVAPPPLSMDWFPMGGPILGASGKINIAYFDALTSMAKLSRVTASKSNFLSRADDLKQSIVKHLWNPTAGTMRMSDIASPTGICQDINAYAITMGLSPAHAAAETNLAAPRSNELPLAFQGLARWEDKKVVSPYASGFAVEALFERGHGFSAIELIERVWGVMADETNVNYSGGHWEAMKPDGSPSTDDTSLMHGWSTWPVYLLPRYLAGLSPLEPGWTRWKVQPVLAGLETVDVSLSTPAGRIEVSLEMQESLGLGSIVLKVPQGSVAEVFVPQGWKFKSSENGSQLSSGALILPGQESKITIAIKNSGEKLSQTVAKSEKVGTASTRAGAVAPGKAPASRWWYGWFRQFSIMRLLLKWFG
ncbi:bacterial alpha-L-rhamnosidase domain-containing protein [Cadophora sp. MPI-SDFR-AT-0126]|nr:bacterial alpha-L-rhamnosidase domain-containing protein [Leotiomycetes sp. MPI-SDFR-AT-0126]